MKNKFFMIDDSIEEKKNNPGRIYIPLPARGIATRQGLIVIEEKKATGCLRSKRKFVL